MNYRDVDMLNGAMENLGNTLARNRLLEERKQERADQSFERQQERADALNLGSERIDAMNKATDARMAMATDAAAQKKKQAVNTVWNDMMKMHGGWVEKGIMKPDVAKKALLTALSQMPDEAKAMLQDNPLAQGIQTEDFTFQEPKGPTESNTAEIKNHEYAKILRAQAQQPGIAPEDAAKLTKMADQFESTIGHQQHINPVGLIKYRSLLAQSAAAQREWSKVLSDENLGDQDKARKLTALKAQVEDLNRQLTDHEKTLSPMTEDEAAPAGDTPLTAPAAPAVDIAKEKQLAIEAIAKKPDMVEAIAEKFKQRTGQDLKF